VLFLGIDIGTTAVKAAVFGLDGARVATWRSDYPTHRAAGGIVEQTPQHWLDAINAAVSAFETTLDLRRIAAVGICSQVNTHVFVGADGRVLADAMVWQDTRAVAEAAELSATVSTKEASAWWGGSAVPVDASHALARMSWMRRHRPSVWDSTRYVLSPKDFCVFRLTGVAMADPIASVGLVNNSLQYIDALIDRVPGAASRLPQLRPFELVAGNMLLGSKGASAPVVNGTMDAWASLFGAGAYAPGKGLYMSGTSEILALVGRKRIGAPGVITFPPVDSSVVTAGPTQSGGDSVRWWGQVIGRQPASIFEAASQANRRDEPILFLPHMEGERAPLWDSGLRGAFVGITSRTGEAELALAVLEGVALSAGLVLRALESGAGFRPESLVYGGGGARSDFWSQLRADCLGLPLERLEVLDAGCLGAAILAAVGIGAFSGLAQAAASMSRVDRQFEPDPKMSRRYELMSSAYLEAVPALKKITQRWSDR
jgi:xylulokinase